MLSELVSQSSGRGRSPGWGHYVVFLVKTLHSHSVSLHPGVKTGASELLGKLNKLQGSGLQQTSIPSRGSRNNPSHFILHKLDKLQRL